MDNVAHMSRSSSTSGAVTAPVTVTTLLNHDNWVESLRADTLRGLQHRPPHIPPVWFYDDAGTALYDQITQLPEYYPTRVERSLLTAVSKQITAAFPASTLVELGSGSAEKTAVLLNHLHGGGLRHYVPLDVSDAAVSAAAATVQAAFCDVAVQCIVGDFHEHLTALPSGGGHLYAFLGSTIGNMDRALRHQFLNQISTHLAPGDAFLVGTDLVKDIRRLEAAYNDDAGVTAAFNKNCLAVMNSSLGATFDPADFDHHARWVPDESRIEMRLEAIRPVHVEFDAWDGFSLRLSAGEWLHTESCHKFTVDGLAAELTEAGLSVVHQWLHPEDGYALTLAQPTA